MPSAMRYALSLSADEPLNLNQLIDEALKNSPELLISETKVAASGFKIPQAKTLPDPMYVWISE